MSDRGANQREQNRAAGSYETGSSPGTAHWHPIERRRLGGETTSGRQSIEIPSSRFIEGQYYDTFGVDRRPLMPQ